MPSAVATVVIPTFNRANLLPDAVNSVLTQTAPCEIVIVDHGSTDSTPKLVTQWGDQVVYLRRNLDSGPEFSWLDGVLRASCEFVKILHDDDWLEPTFIERCLALMSPTVGFVATAATVTDMQKNPINTLFDSLFSTSGIRKSRSDRNLVAETMISPTALLSRRQDLIDGIYAGRLPFQVGTYHGAGADHYLKLLSMLRYPEFGFVNEPLANFRAHPGSITVNAFASGKKSPLNRVYSEVLDYYRFLDFAQRANLIPIVVGAHKIRKKVLEVPGFLSRYFRQVMRVGLIPLRLRRTRTPR